LIKARRASDFMMINRDGTALLSAFTPDIRLVLLSSLAAREPQLSPYAASKRAAEEVVSGRSGPWLIVRAPAVYGPGDRETLAYFKAASRGFALQPWLRDARLSLIHVADLAEALAVLVDKPPESAVMEIDDGHEGGYLYRDMARAAGKALGRRVWSVAVPRPVMEGVAIVNGLLQSVGGPVQILSGDKVKEIFHKDWCVRDHRWAAAVPWRVRYGLEEGFGDTVAWYRRHGWLRSL
jgi:nucleoside-diphosphate-sugar epimerase